MNDRSAGTPRHLERGSVAGLLCGALLLVSCPARGEDWPCYQKDARRSAVTPERPAFPLGVNWVHRSAAPEPAWPEPGRAANALDFDYAPQPVAAGGLVWFGSSADDTLYALDASDGSVKWTYTAGAPIRFAPHLADDKCYVASDDGTVYCLDARTGALVWEHQTVKRNRMVSGNGRMISRWPCRSGVLVVDGVVYATSGMWPSEGTFVYALDAKTGKAKWCNDTTSGMYLAYPHDGLSFGGPTLQGYLLTDGQVLIAPTGLSAPAGFDTKTGRLLYWHPQGCGSTWATLGSGHAMVAARGWQTDQEIRLGEGPLWEPDGIAFYSLKDGKLDPDRKWAGYNKLPGSVRQGKERMRGQIDPLGGRDRIVCAGEKAYVSGMGVIEALDLSGPEIRQVWKIEHPRVYSLALAGDTLLAGGQQSVIGINAADGNVVWKANVDGQARGLAVAGGALFVTTDKGSLYAFAAGKPNQEPPAGPAPGKGKVATALPKGMAVDAELRGFALVTGSHDTALAEALAERSRLNVICLLRDKAAVTAARKRLLGRNYGTGVVVHAVPEDGKLPYADYFANRIFVDGGGGGIAPQELYRVLHPCTGRLDLLNLDRAAAAALVKAAGVPQDELKEQTEACWVERGGLAGAFDWDSKNELDERVRWPLELLWFGGPGRDRIMARHQQGPPPPIPAHGRVFVEGKSHVIAVDAYNGTELWARYAPGYRYVSADDRSAYIAVQASVIQCDAQTGRLEKVYGAVRPVVFSLERPCSFDAKKGNKYSGSIRIAKTEEEIEVTLETNTPTPDDKDCWMLCFDFRGPAERLSPSGRGLFPVFINTKSATFRKYKLAPEAVPPDLSLTRVEGSPGTLLLKVPLEQVRRLTGKAPASFDLRAEIELYQKERMWLSEKPLTKGSDLMHDGTATFVLSGAKDSSASPWSLAPQADLGALPAVAKEWGRTPYHKRHDGNIPLPPLAAEKNEKLRERTNVITGEKQELRYLRAYGCSGTISSATMDFFRSGTLGMYDLSDDGGMRNFPGVKPGCRITMCPALGVLFSAEGNADCFCPYNFATSLALAPAARRKNEDWSLFYDQMKVAPVRRMALNLGAPGDRRDESATLWVGYPRQTKMFATGGAFGPEAHTFGIPLALETFDGSRTVRVNADRVPIEGTNVPWVCASSLLGVRKLSLGLVYHEPRSSCLAYPVAAPPKMDAVLDEPCWAEDPGVVPSERAENGRVRIRYDAQNLYLAYDEPPVTDRKERPAGKAAAREHPGAAWAENGFDVVLKDSTYPLAVQFAVSPGGAKYAAEISYSVDVPKAENIQVDGKADDWGKQGVVLGLAEGRGSVRLAWCPEGLLVLTTLPKDFFSYEKAWTSLREQLVNAASPAILETVLDAASQSVEAIEAAIEPKPDSARHDLNMYRPSRKLEMKTAFARTEDALVVEALFPLEKLGLKAAPSSRLGLKLVAYNPKAADPNITSGAGSRRAALTDGILLALHLADGAPRTAEVKCVSARREWYGSVMLFAPPAYRLPPDSWSGAAADQAGLRAEATVPIEVLNALGLSADRLLALFKTPGKMEPDVNALAREFAQARRVYLSKAEWKPGTYTVRLHFAELAEVKPGERVFSVKLQGKTVLEALDVAKEAGGPRRAVVKTFPGVAAGKVMDLEFCPKAEALNENTLPILNGIELLAEEQ